MIPSLEETAEGPLERGLVELGGGERDHGSFETLVKTYPRTTELEIVGKDVPLVAETIPRGTLLLIIQTNLSRLVCCWSPAPVKLVDPRECAPPSNASPRGIHRGNWKRITLYARSCGVRACRVEEERTVACCVMKTDTDERDRRRGRIVVLFARSVVKRVEGEREGDC